MQRFATRLLGAALAIAAVVAAHSDVLAQDVWTLKQPIRRFVPRNDFAQIVSERADPGGGSVDINVDGKVLGLCPGGIETVHFEWHFPQDIARVSAGMSLDAKIEARPAGSSKPCPGGIADRSNIVLYGSSGVTSPLSEDDRRSVEIDRFYGHSRGGIDYASAKGKGEQVTATVVTTPGPLKPDSPNAYFYIALNVPGSAPSIAYVYYYEGHTAGGGGGGGGGNFSIEPGTDRMGGDYRDFDLPQARFELCRDACASDAMCKAFTYADPGFRGPNAHCWLKSTVYPGRPAAGPLISGVKGAGGPPPPPNAAVSVEPNTDRMGSDYRSFDLPQPDYQLCRQACAGDPVCRAYTYVRPGVQKPSAVCYLKAAVPPAKPSDCCTSGVKG
jgi:hypothetical protein